MIHPPQQHSRVLNLIATALCVVELASGWGYETGDLETQSEQLQWGIPAVGLSVSTLPSMSATG